MADSPVSSPTASLSVSVPLVSAAGAAGSFPTSPLVVVPVVSVPCFVSPTALVGSSEGQFGLTHQSALPNATTLAQMQLQEGCTPSSDSFQSPISPFPFPTPLKQAPLLKSENDKRLSESQDAISHPKFTKSAAHLVKATSSDGYNWRKYGHKQVKSSELSRSYFRCTNVSCFAKKKVEHLQDGQVTEIIYRGQHTHGPPLLRTRTSRERGSRPSGCGFLGGNEYMEIPKVDVSVSKYYTDNKKEKGSQSDAGKVHSSSDSDGDPNTSVEYSSVQQGVKQRHCENTVASPRSSKSVKETKTVVRRASDSELANDGYRWRKYGQKIVKGCLSPRSYYKCTITGCRVRKHVEKASEDPNSVIITYEGKHNHDLVPSKSGNEAPMTATSHLTPAATLLMVAEIATDKETPTKSTLEENKLTPKKTSELGGDMALESAKTLLSIRCNPTLRKNGKLDDPRTIPRPLFDGNHSAVQVQNS